MRRLAVILAVVLSLTQADAASLKLPSGGAGARVLYGTGGTYPTLDGLSKYSLMLWLNPSALLGGGGRLVDRNTAKRFIVQTAGGKVRFDDNVGSTLYDSVGSSMTIGIWNCVGYTFDVHGSNGQKVHFFFGTSTASIIDIGQAATSDTALLLNDSGTGWEAGDNTASSNPGDYGMLMISTGIWTARDFQEQQFNPHVTTSTLLFSVFGSTPTPDYSGNNQPSTIVNMSPATTGPPTYNPEVSW